jgi:hypothetical protein
MDGTVFSAGCSTGFSYTYGSSSRFRGSAPMPIPMAYSIVSRSVYLKRSPSRFRAISRS